MEVLFAVVLVLASARATTQTTATQFPSCDLTAQRALQGDIGGSVRDARQAHVLMRANILQADIGAALKAGRLSRVVADGLNARVRTISAGANRYTKRQGFLSAGETASYDRELDMVASQLCRR